MFRQRIELSASQVRIGKFVYHLAKGNERPESDVISGKYEVAKTFREEKANLILSQGGGVVWSCAKNLVIIEPNDIRIKLNRFPRLVFSKNLQVNYSAINVSWSWAVVTQ